MKLTSSCKIDLIVLFSASKKGECCIDGRVGIYTSKPLQSGVRAGHELIIAFYKGSGNPWNLGREYKTIENTLN